MKTRILSVLALAALMVVTVAGAAFATESTAVTTVNSGMTSTFADVTSIVTGNSGKLFALLALTIGLSFGVKLIRRWVKP